MSKTNEFYVSQLKNYGLGNFISLTPTIQKVYEQTNTPVNVYFESLFVQECFLDCPWINSIDTPPTSPHLTSGLTNPILPDYQYIFKNIHKTSWNNKYHTYVDSPPEYDFSSEKYLVIVNGCAQGHWEGKKETPEFVHRFIKENSNLPIYYIGSTRDLEVNSPWMKDLTDKIELDNIRKCLALLRDSTKIISNDTGLAHAAGALNKSMLILWKDTPFMKNQNPGKNTQYAQEHEWRNKLINYLR